MINDGSCLVKVKQLSDSRPVARAIPAAATWMDWTITGKYWRLDFQGHGYAMWYQFPALGRPSKEWNFDNQYLLLTTVD